MNQKKKKKKKILAHKVEKSSRWDLTHIYLLENRPITSPLGKR